jgi:hypothetical protein
MEMTIDSHDRGSERSHNQEERECQRNWRKQMSQEEIDRELVELKERLSIIMELLQESNEDQRQGWNVRKKVKWPIVHLFMKKLMHIMNVFLRTEEKLKKRGGTG